MFQSRVALAVGAVVMLAAAGFMRFGGTPGLPTADLDVNGTRIRAEIAATSVARAKGLSGRESLAPGTGMIFRFPTPSRYGFWMIDMRFPIDIIWMREGTVVDIAADVPPPAPGTPQGSLPNYLPRLPADSVLEVPAGTASTTGLTLGQTVTDWR